MSQTYVIEADEIDLDIIAQKIADGKVAENWIIPFMTYDLVQMGYPTPDHGTMVARPFSGTNDENELIPGNG